MKICHTLSLVVLIGSSLVACGSGKPEQVKLGNGAFSVEAPRDISFVCQILQHAIDCGNYNIPNSIDGMEVRLCKGESKKTTFFTVTGKHPSDPRADMSGDLYAGFASGWSRCQDAKMANSTETDVGGKKAMDYVLTTPLGNGATRVFVENGYSVMVLALPKHERSDEEISGFVTSFRPLAAH